MMDIDEYNKWFNSKSVMKQGLIAFTIGVVALATWPIWALIIFGFLIKEWILEG